MHGKFKSLADNFYYYFQVCIFCKILKCRHKECATPTCRKDCLKAITGYNTNFKYVCAECYDYYLKEFEQQYPPRKQLRIKTEDDNA